MKIMTLTFYDLPLYILYNATSSLFILTLLFVCAGSGDLAALGILENGFKLDLEVRYIQLLLNTVTMIDACSQNYDTYFGHLLIK